MLVYTIFTVMILSLGSCENIAAGKTAKQISSLSGYGPSRALNIAYSAAGSLTGIIRDPWWEVDLMGYYSIDNITLIAVNNAWTIHMRNAYVEVLDKDMELCPDYQSVWCGNVSDTVALKEEFTMTCDTPFPVRFIRVRRKGASLRLSLGHVDVRGKGTKKRYRSYYLPTANRRVNQPFLITSAMTAGDCGIKCHQHYSCIHFSFSTTAPQDANCMMTNKKVPQYSVASSGWTLHTHEDCR